MATKSWAATLPPKISTRLRGCAASTLRCAHTSEALGRSFAAASRRHRGTAKTRPRATPITTMAITMSQTSFESLLEPLLVGDELKWRLPYARGRAMRKRAPLTIQLAVLTSTPDVTAVVASYPSCWKNRTLVASWIVKGALFLIALPLAY